MRGGGGKICSLYVERGGLMSNSKIHMGNDEFILYIKKIYPSCKVPNPELGQKIWAWLSSKKEADAKQVKTDVCCIWPDGSDLPMTAAQFSFYRGVLPSLYDYLDTLGKGE